MIVGHREWGTYEARHTWSRLHTKWDTKRNTDRNTEWDTEWDTE